MFEYKYKVKFHDVDGAGIIFFANVFKIAHDAYQEMLNSFELEEDYFRSKEYAIPIVHTEANYINPIKFNDDIVVNIKVIRIGSSSFQLEYILKDKESKNEYAKLITSHVFVKTPRFEKSKIPENFKNKLKSFD